MESNSSKRENCKGGSWAFRTANVVPGLPEGDVFPSPLPIEKGGFSGRRTYSAKGVNGNNITLTFEISATFTSATKVAGTLSIKGKPLLPPQGKELWEKEANEEYYEGGGMCANGKVTFMASLLPPKDQQKPSGPGDE